MCLCALSIGGEILHVFFFSFPFHSRRCRIPDKPLDLLDRMLTLDPEKRITASVALEHEYLRDVNPERIPPPWFVTWEKQSI